MGKKSDFLNIINGNKWEVVCGTFEDMKRIDDEYCQFTLYKEKLQLVTYLREFFYGKEATTGPI